MAKQYGRNGEGVQVIYYADHPDDYSIGYQGDAYNRRPVLINREGATAYVGNQGRVLNRWQGKVWAVENKRWDNRWIGNVDRDELDSLLDPSKIRWNS